MQLKEGEHRPVGDILEVGSRCIDVSILRPEEHEYE